MHVRASFIWVTIALTALACSSKGPPSGPNECGAGGVCPDGFVCDSATNLCVMAGGGADARPADAKPVDASPIDATVPATDATVADANLGTVPDTTITQKPAAFTNVTAVKIDYTSTVANSTFQCKLNTAAYAACTPPFMQTLAPGTYTFDVFAVGPGGAVDPTPAEVQFVLDTTAPETTISSAPTGTVTDTSATLAFASNETGSTFTCQIDSQPAAACVSGQNYSGLGVGDHTFTVFATDQAGNADPSPATATWTIGPAIGDTFIDLHPDSTTASTKAHLTFHSDVATATFECSLDAQPFVACTSPQDYFSLAVGSHGFDVRAVTANGADPTPAIIRWNIDQSAITTAILSGADAGGVSGVGCASTTFTFSATGDNLHYECSLDGAGFSACATSGVTYTSLTGGVTHVFAVHAIDADGDVGPDASQSFTVDVTAPAVAITAPVNLALTNGHVNLIFAAEANATVTCAVDGSALTPCTSGAALPGLTDGNHSVTVTAADACLNHNTASVMWMVDATPPVVAITAPAAGAFVPAVGTIHYTVGDSATTKCTMDGHAVDCDLGGLYQYAGLPPGTHTFTISGTDAAGNVSAPASLTFTIDAEPPVVTSLTLGTPHGGEIDVTAHLSDPSGVLQVYCVIDGVTSECGFGPNLSVTLSYLGGGTHTVEVYGLDGAGNSGQMRPPGAAPTPHAITSFSSRVQGRAVLFSFDFSDISTPGHDAGLSGGPLEMMLANAVTSSQVWPAHAPRVVGFRWLGNGENTGVDPDACANALDAISIKLGGSGDCDNYSGYPWYSQFSDPSQLAAQLANADVLLVHSLKDPEEANALGRDGVWIPTLIDWMNKGGVLIVLDGQHNQGPGFGTTGPIDATFCTLCDCQGEQTCSLVPATPAIMHISQAQSEARVYISSSLPYVVNQPDDPVAVGLGFTSFAIPHGAVTYSSQEKFAVPVVHWSAFLLGPLGWPTAAHAIDSAGVLDRPYPDAVRVDVQRFHDQSNNSPQSYLNPKSWVAGAKVVFEDESGDVQVVTTDGGGTAIASLNGGGNVTVAVNDPTAKTQSYHLTSFVDVPPNIGLAVIDQPYPAPSSIAQTASVVSNSPESQPANADFYVTVNQCLHSSDDQLPAFYIPGEDLDYDPINFSCHDFENQVDLYAYGLSTDNGDLVTGVMPHYEVDDSYTIPEFSEWSAPPQLITFQNPTLANTSFGTFAVTYFDTNASNPSVLRGPVMSFDPSVAGADGHERHSFPPPGPFSGYQTDISLTSSTDNGVAVTGQSRSIRNGTEVSSKFNLNSLLPYITNPTLAMSATPQIGWTLGADGSATSSMIAGGFQLSWFDDNDNQHDWRIIFPAGASTNSVTAPTLPADVLAWLPDANSNLRSANLVLLGYDIDDPLHQINSYQRFLDGNMLDPRPLEAQRGEPDFPGYPYTVWFPTGANANPLWREFGTFRYTSFAAGREGGARSTH